MFPFNVSVDELFFTAAIIFVGNTIPEAMAAEPVKTCLISLRLLTFDDMAKLY
jgi:hypothetical protein